MKTNPFITGLILSSLLSFPLFALAKNNPAIFHSSSADTIGIYVFNAGKSPYCYWDAGSYYTSIELSSNKPVPSVLPKDRLFCLSTMDNNIYGPYVLTQGCIVQTNKYKAVKDENPPIVQTNITVSAGCIPKGLVPIYISSQAKNLVQLRFSKYNGKNTCRDNVNLEQKITGISLFPSNASYIGIAPGTKICAASIKAGFTTHSYGPFTPRVNCILTIEEDGSLTGSSACQ